MLLHFYANFDYVYLVHAMSTLLSLMYKTCSMIMYQLWVCTAGVSFKNSSATVGDKIKFPQLTKKGA